MNYSHFFRGTVITLILVSTFSLWAQKKPGDAASIKNVEVAGPAQAGAKVTAKIRVALEKGFHTHSNKPSEKQFIPTVLTVDPVKGVTAGTVEYPAGKSVKVEGLAKPLSVYEQEFELAVPLTLPADAVLPLKIPATLSYQACQGSLCYPPRKLKFDIVVGAATK